MQKRFQLRWLLNLGLLLAVIVLVLLAWPDKPQEIKEQKSIASFLPATVEQIRISRPGKKEIHFQLADTNWRMLAPHAIRADNRVVQQLLSIRELAIRNMINKTDIKLADFGLTQPEVRLSFNETEIAFGDVQPVGKQRYILLGDLVMLIEDKHAAQLKASSISYIDRQLIPLGNRISRLVINEKTIDLEQNQELLDRWLEIKAGWLSYAGHDSSVGLPIEITLADNTRLHYLADKRDNDVVLINPDNRLEYHLTFTTLDSLGIDPQEPGTGEPDSGSQQTR